MCVFDFSAKGTMSHTGWCILSNTTAIPHMVRQGDALMYYPALSHKYGTF